MKEILEALRRSDELYAIISGCTRMPFVICDDETYDDEIFIFRILEDAKAFAKQLQEVGNSVQIAKLENKQFLAFYSMLYTTGVNCILVDKDTESEMPVQIHELVTRKEETNSPDKKVRVENPQLHLTALYLMQKLRAGSKEIPGDVKELQEEMLAHFKEGSYIVPVQEGKGIPLLKQKEGGAYQPVFTDQAEFAKFNQGNSFQTAVVEFQAIANMLTPEAAGVVVNPLGVNVQFEINRKQA